MDCLVEERDAEMVVFNGSQKPIKRKGLFLNPISKDSPFESLKPYVNFSSARKAPKYHSDFRWWPDPQPQWPLWIKKLKPKYHNLWLKTGIYDAIMTSRHKIKRHPTSLLGVARFWCKGTNTFVFPWAEATVTLEDVMILGGFPVLGEPVRVRKPLKGVIGHMEAKMIKELNSFNRKYAKYAKATQFVWMRHFMRIGKGDEVEHIAFLALWLSRFVLAAPDGKTIRECVVQVAVRLARGVRVALAPAVLASIYRDLGVMRDHICNSTHSLPLLAVWAPMNILQIWVWKRFKALKSELNSLTQPHSTTFVMSVFTSPDEFRWQPYAVEGDQRCNLSFDTDDGGLFSSNMTQDEGLQSFPRCLRACELVGLDCIELYLPHRVAMQFGLDQDIPDFLPRANSTWEVAWETYNISSKSVKFYIPPRLVQSAVTLRYSNWQRTFGRKEMTSGKKRKEAQFLPNTQTKKVKDLNGTSTSARPALKHHEIRIKSICLQSQERQTYAVKTDPLDANEEGIIEGDNKTDVEFHNDLNVIKKSKVENEKQLEEECKHNLLDASEGVTKGVKETIDGEDHNDLTEIAKLKEQIEKQPEKECISDPLYFNMQGITTGIKKTDTEEFDYDCTVIEKPKATCETKDIKERNEAMKKELEREQKISQLKEEIAYIQARVTYFESLAKAHSKSELISSTN